MIWSAQWWATDRDYHIHPKGRNRQRHDKHDGGQHIESVTYKLGVETGNDMVSMMVGRTWRLSLTSYG